MRWPIHSAARHSPHWEPVTVGARPRSCRMPCVVHHLGPDPALGPGLGPGHHGWVPADPQKVGFDPAKLGKAGEAVGRVAERCKEKELHVATCGGIALYVPT